MASQNQWSMGFRDSSFGSNSDSWISEPPVLDGLSRHSEMEFHKSPPIRSVYGGGIYNGFDQEKALVHLTGQQQQQQQEERRVGKGSKRKSRSLKRSQTTFIAADPANFRQMVQQVTGVTYPPDWQLTSLPLSAPLKTIGDHSLSLPTLDSANFCLDHDHQRHPTVEQQVLRIGGSCYSQPLVSHVGDADEADHAVHCTSLSSSYPTLESWKLA